MGWHRVRIHRQRINCDIRELRPHGWLELQQGERDGNRRCSRKLHRGGRQLGRRIPRDIGQHWGQHCQSFSRHWIHLHPQVRWLLKKEMLQVLPKLMVT